MTVFIDGSNFYHGLKNNIGHTAIDFNAFTSLILENRYLVRVKYYNVMLSPELDKEEYERQHKFFAYLRELDYFDMTLVELVSRGQERVEKGVDISIAVDMLTGAFRNTYDTALLVSGDGDFVPVVEAIKTLGKHVENVYFDKGLSYALRTACDRYVPLRKEHFKKAKVNWNSISAK